MNSNYDYPDRKDFLIEMYKQLSNEIDRHIKVIWQIVGVLLSTFTVYALVQKNALSLDMATSILVLVSGLSVAIVIESNYWYNRNLVIISNIERQFLLDSDSKDIHYYFTKHRSNNAYLDMMVIQIIFVLVLLLIVIAYHFFIQVWPYRHLCLSHFDPIKSFPYFALIICVLWNLHFHFKRRRNYNDFKRESPGISISSQDVPSNSDHITK